MRCHKLVSLLVCCQTLLLFSFRAIRQRTWPGRQRPGPLGCHHPLGCHLVLWFSWDHKRVCLRRIRQFNKGPTHTCHHRLYRICLREVGSCCHGQLAVGTRFLRLDRHICHLGGWRYYWTYPFWCLPGCVRHGVWCHLRDGNRPSNPLCGGHRNDQLGRRRCPRLGVPTRRSTLGICRGRGRLCRWEL